MNKSGRGRRKGNPDTRQQIIEVARARFLAEGYQKVSLRSIAAAAGVDVALISYFFGSKRGLFGAALALSVNPAELFASQLAQADLATLPQRALALLLASWDDPEHGAVLRALALGAIEDPAMGQLLSDLIEREIIDALADRLGPDGRQRAARYLAVMAGTIFTRHILRIEPLASMTRDELMKVLVPVLARALAPMAPVAPPRRTG